MSKSLVLSFAIILAAASCAAETEPVICGAERSGEYLHLLQDRNVAIVANQTSMIGSTHLLDTMLSLGVRVTKVFAPEHGFREMASAGAHIPDGRDVITGVSVVSLYGSNFKPRPGDLQDVDILIFDIQDVGARFYTYISTMHYVMEACAENHLPCIILDRPNPNGHYVDGPMLEPAFRSFVGMHPVPVVHGMTIGEYALMINGEGWLEGGLKCDLHIVQCLNYSHSTPYVLPVRPSPNLPDSVSVALYPSLCLFEGCAVSVGRGTPWPFQVVGSPGLAAAYDFSFTPRELPGAANPLYNGVPCYGLDLRDAPGRGLLPMSELNIGWLMEVHRAWTGEGDFFRSYFDRLAGSATLRQQIEAGMSEAEIRAGWQPDLAGFRKVREKYLLYPED